jgi:hypothetical protein
MWEAIQVFIVRTSFTYGDTTSLQERRKIRPGRKWEDMEHLGGLGSRTPKG